MREIRCFWLEPAEMVDISLRRFKHGPLESDGLPKECPIHGYHDAAEHIGQTAVSDCPRLYAGRPVIGDLWSHEDPRWPTHCDCGYEFSDRDEWQYNPRALYVREDTGDLVTLRNAPAGAMMHADWLTDIHGYKTGPDGYCLQVKTPDGWWQIDGPSYSDGKRGPGWTRTGTAPNITAHPSILMTHYHGWLRDGVLVEC